MNYQFFMREAYKEALKAFYINEVPIGCIIVSNNEIIGRGYNKRNSNKNVLCHAEIFAIDQACKNIGDWRLENTTLFVTVEPCAMCSGAILQARIDKVVFATRNEKAGCCGSILNLLDNNNFNHKAEIIEGVLEEECKSLIKHFFKKIREKNSYI